MLCPLVLRYRAIVCLLVVMVRVATALGVALQKTAVWISITSFSLFVLPLVIEHEIFKMVLFYLFFCQWLRSTCISTPAAYWWQWSGSKGITLVNTQCWADLTGHSKSPPPRGGSHRRENSADVCWWPCMWQCSDGLWDRVGSRAWTGCPDRSSSLVRYDAKKTHEGDGCLDQRALFDLHPCSISLFLTYIVAQCVKFISAFLSILSTLTCYQPLPLFSFFSPSLSKWATSLPCSRNGSLPLSSNKSPMYT